MKLVNNGADVLFAAGGETANAALETAGQQGAAVIGSETDMYAEFGGHPHADCIQCIKRDTLLESGI